jgi:hypothetical protein
MGSDPYRGISTPYKRPYRGGAGRWRPQDWGESQHEGRGLQHPHAGQG